MYVSVRSRLELKDGELLHPCYIRLMRRLIRDGFFRGRSAAETLDMFDSVEAGENKYIMPYKHRAEFSVDTFHAYEPALYKNYLWIHCDVRAGAIRILNAFCLCSKPLRR